ncbi:MAG: biopolymer transporter ExbD [Sphingomonas sp.]
MSARAIAIRSQANSDFEPLSQLNITPLIDVMLVLLVMMILSIPTMTHKVPLDLPQPGTLTMAKPVTHMIDLDARGTVAWDGTPVDDVGLKARLDAVRADPNVAVQIRADAAARYERFDQTLAVIEKAGITKLGFIGNERFKDFTAGK